MTYLSNHFTLSKPVHGAFHEGYRSVCRNISAHVRSRAVIFVNLFDFVVAVDAQHQKRVLDEGLARGLSLPQWSYHCTVVGALDHSAVMDDLD